MHLFCIMFGIYSKLMRGSLNVKSILFWYCPILSLQMNLQLIDVTMAQNDRSLRNDLKIT